MKYLNWHEKLIVAGGCLLVAAFLTLAVFTFGWWAPTEMKLHKFCLSRGYRSYDIDYGFNKYCIKRLDQTDVVVPVEDVK